MTAMLSDPYATDIITQTTSLSGSATIKVTAEDGITTQTYTVNFSVASAPATINSLTVSPGTLNPTFSPSIYEYTENVANKRCAAPLFLPALVPRLRLRLA